MTAAFNLDHRPTDWRSGLLQLEQRAEGGGFVSTEFGAQAGALAPRAMRAKSKGGYRVFDALTKGKCLVSSRYSFCLNSKTIKHFARRVAAGRVGVAKSGGRSGV